MIIRGLVHRTVLVSYTILLIRAIDTMGVFFTSLCKYSTVEYGRRNSPVSPLSSHPPPYSYVCHIYSTCTLIPTITNLKIAAEERKKEEPYTIQGPSRPALHTSPPKRKPKLAIRLENTHIS